MTQMMQQCLKYIVISVLSTKKWRRKNKEMTMTEQKLQKLTHDKQTGWLTERRQLSPRKQCRMTATQLRLPLFMIFSMLNNLLLDCTNSNQISCFYVYSLLVVPKNNEEKMYLIFTSFESFMLDQRCTSAELLASFVQMVKLVQEFIWVVS